jgi:hypothetical protein
MGGSSDAVLTQTCPSKWLADAVNEVSGSGGGVDCLFVTQRPAGVSVVLYRSQGGSKPKFPGT